MLQETFATAFSIVFFIGLLVCLGPILSNTLPPHKPIRSEQQQIQKLTTWLIRRIVEQSNYLSSAESVDMITHNRARGAAVKALYHLKKNKSVRIQLPNLIATENGYADFEISMTQSQLEEICA